MNQLPIDIIIHLTKFELSYEIFALYCSSKKFKSLFNIYKKTKKKNGF